MKDGCVVKIPQECRLFGAGNSKKRLNVSRDFISKLVENVATPKNLDHSDEAWTQSVRGRLMAICPDDCHALFSAPNAARAEYLVSCLWTYGDKGSGVLLACEIAWGTGWFGKTDWSLVKHNFEKLLAVKAPFKVLIFSSREKQASEPAESSPEINFSFECAKERIKASLENYGHHLAGEIYIFIDFPQTGISEGKGTYRSFIWMVKKSGAGNLEFYEDGKERTLRRPSEFKVKWA